MLGLGVMIQKQGGEELFGIIKMALKGFN